MIQARQKNFPKRPDCKPLCRELQHEMLVVFVVDVVPDTLLLSSSNILN
jgi:hypothetical protein